MNCQDVYDRYRDELLGSVVPFWEKHCQDREYGGYFTFLDRDGSIYDTEKYMWVQWRIVYQFASLAATPFAEPHWVDIAKDGYTFLTRNGKDENGNYYFALNRQGVPSICPYNIYSECFAAMGAAALFKVTEEPAYREEAVSAMKKYEARVDDPKGKWNKKLQGTPKRLSLGHYMMLANLGCLMNDVFENNDYDAVIETAFDKVMNTFWNPELQVIFENVNTDGSFDLKSCDGRHVNPGHGLESLWFLLQYAEQSKDPSTITRIADMITAQLKFGWDEQYGGIYYFMDVLNKPQVELQTDMKLWWVHNEALLALLFALRLTGGRKDLLEWFDKVDSWTWQHFPDREFGEWFGYLSRQGEPTHQLKGGKWKTFFHLPRFLLMGMEQVEDKAGCSPT